jgi:hypothetical protein
MERGRRKLVFNGKPLKMFNAIGKGDFLSMLRIRIQLGLWNPDPDRKKLSTKKKDKKGGNFML